MPPARRPNDRPGENHLRRLLRGGHPYPHRAGEVAVEAIRVGDAVRVLLGDGLAPVIWVGRREVDCTRHPQPRKVWPVRVAAGAFGPGRPHTRTVSVAGSRRLCRRGADPDQAPDQRHHDRAGAGGPRYLPPHRAGASTTCCWPRDCRRRVFWTCGTGRTTPNRPGPVRLYPDFSARMWEAFGCARLVVTGPELAAARALVARFAVAREAA